MDYKEKIIALLNSQELSKEQKEKLEEIFPELKESEDERIKSAAIEFVIQNHSFNYYLGISKDDVITWIEKQCGQKLVWSKEDKNMLEWIKAYLENKMLNTPISEERTACKNAVAWLEEKLKGQQTSTDKVKPKFKVGDKIYLNPKYRMPTDDTPIANTIKEIIAIDDKRYIFNGAFVFIEDQDKYELVEQKPAAWSEEDESWFKELELMALSFSNDDSYRKKFFDWLKSIKDRVQPQQKQEWSEEDERLRRGCIGAIQLGNCASETKQELHNWLKSLRPQKQQEWNKRDIEMIDWLIRCCEKEHEELCNDRYGHQDIVSDLKRDCRKKWDWLESLKNKVVPQNRWKPSDEQIKALEWQVNNTSESSWQYEESKNLLKQIKKLREE